jgi:hypothetical protein
MTITILTSDAYAECRSAECQYAECRGAHFVVLDPEQKN